MYKRIEVRNMEAGYHDDDRRCGDAKRVFNQA